MASSGSLFLFHSTAISTFDEAEVITPLESRLCGQIGSIPKTSASGIIIDPPAERLYPVEPVGVVTMIPSP